MTEKLKENESDNISQTRDSRLVDSEWVDRQEVAWRGRKIPRMRSKIFSCWSTLCAEAFCRERVLHLVPVFVKDASGPEKPLRSFSKFDDDGGKNVTHLHV